MSLLSRLRSVLPGGHPLIPREPIVYRAIGVVRNRVNESRTEGWADVKSDIILREELVEALDAIEGFSHVLVVFDLDRIPDAARRLRVQVGNEDVPPERGDHVQSPVRAAN